VDRISGEVVTIGGTYRGILPSVLAAASPLGDGHVRVDTSACAGAQRLSLDPPMILVSSVWLDLFRQDLIVGVQQSPGLSGSSTSGPSSCRVPVDGQAAAAGNCSGSRPGPRRSHIFRERPARKRVLILA
jgi:hypothetical protein